jgi:hypothetical protein
MRPRRRRRMVILRTRMDAITTGTRTDTDVISCATATVITTMAARLSRCLLWPALVLRWALSWQPGMPAHSRPLSGPLAAAMMPAHALGRGPFVATRHACACPRSGPLAAGIRGLHSASASALDCNASGFAVVAPSATPASSRPGQRLPQQGKARRLRLAVFPQLRLQS